MQTTTLNGSSVTGLLLEKMKAISIEAFAKPPWCLASPFPPTLAKLIIEKECYVFLASEGSSHDICGFALLTQLTRANIELLCLPPELNLSEGDWHLSWTAVRPSSQRGGIGTLLLQARLKHASSYAPKPVHIATLANNFGWLRTLRAHGFSVTRTVLETTPQGLRSMLYLQLDP